MKFLNNLTVKTVSNLKLNPLDPRDLFMYKGKEYSLIDVTNGYFDGTRSAPCGQCPSTWEVNYTGLLAEYHVYKMLMSNDRLIDVEWDGLEQRLATAKAGHLVHSSKPDLSYMLEIDLCMPNPKCVNVEVKSGNPDRYHWRQYKVSAINGYIRNGVDLLVWVDIDHKLFCSTHSMTPIQQVKTFRQMANVNGDLCYTMVCGQGTDRRTEHYTKLELEQEALHAQQLADLSKSL